MAYFLGIEVAGNLKPLKLYDKNGIKIPDEILNIVALTSTFEDEDELFDYLSDTGIISSKKGKLVYLIDKGQKGNKTYHLIPGCNQIIYSNFRDNFVPSIVRKTLHERSLNLDFYEQLYAFYLKKYGLYLGSLNVLKNLAKEPYEFKRVLDSLMRYPISEQTKSFLFRIIDILNTAIVRGDRSFFIDSEAAEYYALVDALDDYFRANAKDIIALCKFFSTKVKNNNIAALGNLSAIYRIVKDFNESDKDELPYYDMEDLSSFIDSFLDFTIYSYDKQRRDFKRVDGKKKLQARNMFDLGVFLTDYDSFELYIYEEINRDSAPQYNNETTFEEFLEEDDFARINTTSEEQGIVLRMSDGQRYSG